MASPRPACVCTHDVAMSWHWLPARMNKLKKKKKSDELASPPCCYIRVMCKSGENKIPQFFFLSFFRAIASKFRHLSTVTVGAGGRVGQRSVAAWRGQVTPPWLLAWYV